MEITNKKQLEDIMDNVIKNSMIELAKKIKEAWQYYIETEFYMQYEPQYYIRTYQLLESVVVSNVVKKGGQWTVEVFMNKDLAKYKTDPSSYVFDLAAQGLHGSSDIQTEGRFFNKILEDLDSGKFFNEFEDIVKNFGLQLK